MKIEYVPTVDAFDFPDDLYDYCLDRDISTHYQNDIIWIENDGNPFAEWLKSNGFVFKEGGAWIGIFAT